MQIIAFKPHKRKEKIKGFKELLFLLLVDFLKKKNVYLANKSMFPKNIQKKKNKEIYFWQIKKES